VSSRLLTRLVFNFQIENLYKQAHAAIREDPVLKKVSKDPSKIQKKRWTIKKLTLEERKARIAQQKEEFLKQVESGEVE